MALRLRDYPQTKYYSFTVVVFLSCLSACSSLPTKVNQDILYAERIVENYQQQYNDFSLRQLHSALATFTSYDQLSQQWSAQFAISNWHSANGDHNLAQKHATFAYELADILQNQNKRYASHIQLGQLSNSTTLFQQALDLTENDIEKAIIYTHLEQYNKAYSLFSNNNKASKEDLAFLYYRYGKYKKHIPSVLKARDLFIITSNKTGVIDSLFLAAQLVQGKPATTLAQRALSASIESLDKAREEVIRSWLRQQL